MPVADTFPLAGTDRDLLHTADHLSSIYYAELRQADVSSPAAGIIPQIRRACHDLL